MSDKSPLELFLDHHGILRISEAQELGIHPTTVYRLCEEGVVEPLDRGLYCLTDMSDFSHYDFIIAAKKVPQGIVCLISALSYYNLTTQIPHALHLALPRGHRIPKLQSFPLSCYLYGKKSYEEGIETIDIDGIPVKIYSKEKTLADCVKFREKIGINIVIEALKEYWRQGDTNLDLLNHYAKICRIEKILGPILQTITTS